MTREMIDLLCRNERIIARLQAQEEITKLRDENKKLLAANFDLHQLVDSLHCRLGEVTDNFYNFKVKNSPIPLDAYDHLDAETKVIIGFKSGANIDDDGKAIFTYEQLSKFANLLLKAVQGVEV